jgi:hypothetical protein
MSSEELIFPGEWWFPGNEEGWVPGTLELGSAFMLKTMADMRDANGNSLELGGPATPLLHGRSLGRCFTLLDCQLRRERVFGGGTHLQIFSPVILIGERNFPTDDVCFDRACLRLDNLNAFANRRTLEYSRSEGNDKRTVVFNKPPDLQADMPGGRLRLGRRSRITSGFDRAEVSSMEFFLLELQDELALDNLLYSYVRPLQQLLSLATAEECNFYELEVARDRDRGENYWHYYQVHLWRREVHAGSRNVANPNMRFSLKSTLGRPEVTFSEVIPRWFAIQEKYGSVLDLVFSLRSGIGYLESQIFAIASSLEGMHRKLFPGAAKRTPEHRERLEAIIASAPQEHKEWLSRALVRSHEPSFANRVHDLVNYAGPAVASLLGDVDEWTKMVGRARNDVGHAKGIETTDVLAKVRLMRSIQMLAEFVLLRELGLTQDQCDSLLTLDAEWNSVSAKLQESYPELFV